MKSVDNVDNVDIIRQIVNRNVAKNKNESSRKRSISVRFSSDIIEMIDSLSMYLGWSRAKVTESIVVQIFSGSEDYIKSLNQS